MVSIVDPSWSQHRFWDRLLREAEVYEVGATLNNGRHAILVEQLYGVRGRDSRHPHTPSDSEVEHLACGVGGTSSRNDAYYRYQ